MSMFAGTPDVDADVGEPECRKHGESMSWEDCTACADGFQGHDCGEDCCACLHPEDNLVCDTCEGNTGWWICGQCAKEPS